MTTYGYETKIVPGGLGGRLTQLALPRSVSAQPRQKHNAFGIRPDRGLTVWQIVNPVEKQSLLALAALVQQQAAARETAEVKVQRVLSATERDAEARLFEEQAELLGRLQWEDPTEFFDVIDVDGNGKLSIDELRAGLVARGLSERMAEPIVRDLDCDDDGQISREEFATGFYSSRLCTVPTPHDEDFSDLRSEAEAGCVIKEPELRASTLRQVSKMRGHIVRRCHEEKWRNFKKEVLTPGAVTLYDAARYIVRPATLARRCSYVELVAIRAQRPRWLVSHWWGTRFYDLVSSLGQHARDRYGRQMLECNYWICALAVNHWNLRERDPLRSGFFRALSQGVTGTVLVLDRQGIALSRVWCMYEVAQTISKSGEILLDVYTALDGGRGVGFAHGRIQADGHAPGGKETRELQFPAKLAEALITGVIEKGVASLEADRTRILNRVAGCHVDDLGNDPAPHSPAYTQINNNVRVRLASATIVRCFSDVNSSPEIVSTFLESLSLGRVRDLDINFDFCGKGFSAGIAKRLALSLPQGIVSLSLRLHGHGDVFVKELSESYKQNRELLTTLRSLDLSGNALGATRTSYQDVLYGAGMRALCDAARNGFLSKLETLKLDSNLLDDIDMATLCKALGLGFERLSFLSLESNKVGETGMDALIKTLKDPYGPPLLERIGLAGNLAIEPVVEAVQRQLKKRGKSARNTYAQNFKT